MSHEIQNKLEKLSVVEVASTILRPSYMFAVSNSGLLFVNVSGTGFPSFSISAKKEIFRSKVTLLDSYRAHTHTHTHTLQADCSTWTTKSVRFLGKTE